MMATIAPTFPRDPSAPRPADPLPSAPVFASPANRRLVTLAQRAEHFARETEVLAGAPASIDEWNELLVLVQRGVGAPIEQLRSAAATPSVNRDLGRASVELSSLFVLATSFALGRPCDMADAAGILGEVASWLYTAAGHSAP